MKLLLLCLSIHSVFPMATPEPTASSFSNWADRLFASAKTTKTTTSDPPSTKTSAPSTPSTTTSSAPSTPTDLTTNPSLSSDQATASDFTTNPTSLTTTSSEQDQETTLDNEKYPGFAKWSNKLFHDDVSIPTQPSTPPPSTSPPIVQIDPIKNATQPLTNATSTAASMISAMLLPPKVLPETSSSHSLRFQAARSVPNATLAKVKQLEQQKEQERQVRLKHQQQQQQDTIDREENERQAMSDKLSFDSEIDMALRDALTKQDEQDKNKAMENKLKEKNMELRLENEKKKKEEQKTKKVKEKQRIEEKKKQHAAQLFIDAAKKKLAQHNQQIQVRKQQIITKWNSDRKIRDDSFLKDIVIHTIPDSSLGVHGCNQIGTYDTAAQKCKCPPGHGGEFCQYKLLTDHHSHGRFIGGSICEHGTIVKQNTTTKSGKNKGKKQIQKEKCICDAGYYGYHCHYKACAHGGVRKCPAHDQFCVKKTCSCTIQYVGEYCGNKNPLYVNGSLLSSSSVLKKGVTEMGQKNNRHSNSLNGYGANGNANGNNLNGNGVNGASAALLASPFYMNGKCMPSKVQLLKCSSNGGVFDRLKCRCTCKGGWYGALCDRCTTSPSECMDGSFRGMNVKSCECQCLPPKKIKQTSPLSYSSAGSFCANKGVWNAKSCSCKCTEHFEGKQCETCARRSCHGHGIWSANQCRCVCRPPWLETSDCSECGQAKDLDCGSHGIFSKKKCGCSCTGGWKGLQCRQCDGEMKKTKGKGCGRFEWDAAACSCSKTKCKNTDCANDSVLNIKTCQCQCNINNQNLIASKTTTAALELKATSSTSSTASTASTASTSSTNTLLMEQEADITNPTLGSGLTRSRSYVKLLPKWMQRDNTDNSDSFLTSVFLGAAFISLDEKAAQTRPPVTADALRNAISSGVKGITFWEGEQCRQCIVPDPLPCLPGHSFNQKTCSCVSECPKSIRCVNGGRLSTIGCNCICSGGWTGPNCEFEADGTTKERASSSCRTILDTYPSSASGVYWLLGGERRRRVINKDQAFQSICDMTTDGGGWTSIGSIGTKLSTRSITSMDYTRGINEVGQGDGSEFIIPCENLDGLDGDPSTILSNFIVRVSMGTVRDYYRPDPSAKTSNKNGIDLCYLLTHHDSFQWSPNAEGMGSTLSTRANQLLEGTEWVSPLYNSGPKTLGILGGSNETWPMQIDGREYLSMWGSAQAPGGCCHYTSKLYTKDVSKEGTGVADLGGWGKQFRIDIIELPDIQDSSDDPLEIVEEENGYGRENGDNGDNGEDVSIKVENSEAKSLLKNELNGEEQQVVVDKEAAAKEREKDFEGLDELFADTR